jgi:MFS family permease
MAALILFRTIQGLGAGAVQPVAITIVGDIFELEARARVQGLFGAVWGISAVVGPAAGGFITELISWRWVFYVNVPFGIIAAVLLAATLTESFERRERNVDYLGTALLTGGLVAVLLALLGGGGAGDNGRRRRCFTLHRVARGFFRRREVALVHRVPHDAPTRLGLDRPWLGPLRAYG